MYKKEKMEKDDLGSVSEVARKLSSSPSSLFWMEDCGSSSVWRNESEETLASEKREESPRGEGLTIRRTNQKDAFISSDGDDLIKVEDVVRGVSSMILKKGLF